MNIERANDEDTAEHLADIRRLAEELLARTFEVGLAASGPPMGTQTRRTPGPYGYAPMADRLYEARSLRAGFFDEDLFGEPAWDILLDLFMQSHQGRQVSVTSACIASRVPSTTALRWIGILLDRGLIERIPDPVDRRRAFVQLSHSTKLKLSSYFEALSDRGIGP